MEFAQDAENHFQNLALGATEPLDIDVFSDETEAREFVNWCIAGSYSDEGIERWWNRPRTQLEGQTPLEVWQDSPEKVVSLAGWLVNRELESPTDTNPGQR